MHAVEEEDAFAQRIEQCVELGAVGSATRAGTFQAFKHALFVAVGL